MDTRNLENMEKDRLVLVLNDFTEQFKEICTQFAGLKASVTSLEKRASSFESKLDNIQVTSPPDISHIRGTISQGINEIKRIMEEQPKSVQQNKRFLHFPEHNASEYYSVILRWVLYIIIATYCFLLLKHVVGIWNR